jgi:hypothetical protein
LWQSCGRVSAGGVSFGLSLYPWMKKGMASLIGIFVGGSVLWIASKGGFESAMSPGDVGQRLEGKTQARGSGADSLEGIHEILAGRRPLPGKFEELEELVRGLSDLEIRSLLDQRQDAWVEGAVGGAGSVFDQEQEEGRWGRGSVEVGTCVRTRSTPGIGSNRCLRLQVTTKEKSWRLPPCGAEVPGRLRNFGVRWAAPCTQLAKLRYFTPRPCRRPCGASGAGVRRGRRGG